MLRLFCNRLLETLQCCPEQEPYPLSSTFKEDLKWILQFLPFYNGVQFINPPPTSSTPITIDACLTGCGGAYGTDIYFTSFPQYVIDQNLNISELEMLNAVISIKLWSKQLANQTIVLQCDNAAAVSVIQTGRGRDPFLLACAREIWTCTAQYHLVIHVEHIAGVNNTMADALSRYHTSSASRLLVDNFIAQNDATVHIVSTNLFELSSVY